MKGYKRGFGPKYSNGFSIDWGIARCRGHLDHGVVTLVTDKARPLSPSIESAYLDSEISPAWSGPRQKF